VQSVNIPLRNQSVHFMETLHALVGAREGLRVVERKGGGRVGAADGWKGIEGSGKESASARMHLLSPPLLFRRLLSPLPPLLRLLLSPSPPLLRLLIASLSQAGRVAGVSVPAEEEFTIHNRMVARLPKDELPPKYSIAGERELSLPHLYASLSLTRRSPSAR
jgi:hypothetical protein